jgi:tRNA(Ile2) C34 agmatinyltransferase TiaS
MAILIECNEATVHSNREITRHNYHCPRCNVHLTSLLLCPLCGTRYSPTFHVWMSYSLDGERVGWRCQMCGEEAMQKELPILAGCSPSAKDV